MLKTHICPFCRYVPHWRTRYVLALRAIDIFLATLEIRYVAYGSESRLRRAIVTSLALPVGQRISSAKRHIESKTYRATRQRRISTSSRRVRHTTDSTCPVLGNISTGVTSPISYPNSLNSTQSLASVSGLQET